MLRLIRLSVLACGVQASLEQDAEQETLLQLRSRSDVEEDCAKGGCKPTRRQCLLYGDPHIKTFDSEKTNLHVFSPLGDYKLVDTDKLKIQARYCNNKNGKGTKAVVTSVAMSGAALFPDKPESVLTIPSWHKELEGDDGIFLDNKAIMSCKFAKKCKVKAFANAGLNITYGRGFSVMTHLKRKTGDHKNAVMIKALGVDIVVNQGTSQQVMLNIAPHLLEGTSGHCGNANGNLKDEPRAVEGVVSDEALVADADRLFSDANPCEGNLPEVNESCDRKAEFTKQCNAEFADADADDLQACITDCCDANGEFPECPIGEDTEEE